MPGGVFSTKNHQGGLDGTDEPSDGKMFEGKGLANCPVAVVKAYLFHFNPKCEALFQKPLTGAKFIPLVLVAERSVADISLFFTHHYLLYVFRQGDCRSPSAYILSLCSLTPRLLLLWAVSVTTGAFYLLAGM